MFKFINFRDGVKRIILRLAAGSAGGRIVVSIGQPWHTKIAELEIKPASGEQHWQELTAEVKAVTGVHALWELFYGQGRDLVDVDWVRFD